MAKKLLSIIEIGGYPHFGALYNRLGYDVTQEFTMRKTLRRLKKYVPDVVVAEFNFQSDFRDRTSSLESLMSLIVRHPETKTIIFYDKEFKGQLAQLQARFVFDCVLPFPIEEDQLKLALESL